MKIKFIAGNWKMNKNAAEAEEFVKELIPLVKNSPHKIVLCVPFTHLKAVAELTAATDIAIGAQNVHWESGGAFTGEISAEMIKESGAQYVIVGHSERRQLFGDTDETVNKRAKAAIAGGLTPIVCIGESLAERANGYTEAVLDKQFKRAFKEFTEEEFGETVIAYEPVWAIGTGRTATAADADETIRYIRKVAADMFGKKATKGICIVYGGSMNEHNAAQLLAMPDIDGGLIGGASLDAAKFAVIAGFKK